MVAKVVFLNNNDALFVTILKKNFFYFLTAKNVKVLRKERKG
jgi:hypothetical protein